MTDVIAGDHHEGTRLAVTVAADTLYVVDGQVLKPPLTFSVDVPDMGWVEEKTGFGALQGLNPPDQGAVFADVAIIWTASSIGQRPASWAGGDG